jgi:hypothetical protein
MDVENGNNLIEHLNQQLESSIRSRDYTAVKVLILYWQDGIDGFREEGQLLGRLFEEKFQYCVDEFAIPTKRSYRQLQQFVSKSLLALEEQADATQGASLLIIHYGGHGDENNDTRQGEEKRSVWAA